MHALTLVALLTTTAVPAVLAVPGPARIPAIATLAPAPDRAAPDSHPVNPRQEPPPPPSPSPPSPPPPSLSPPSPSPPSPSPPSPTEPASPNQNCHASLAALLSSLPTPTGPTFSAWASSSAPIQLIAQAITDTSFSFVFTGLLNLNNPTPTPTITAVDLPTITALCRTAAEAASKLTPTASDLSAAYSSYLDAVQSWRYDVEGEAYKLAERCGYEVGLGVELLMATEAAMCASGLKASVKPWSTGGVLAGTEEDAAGTRRRASGMSAVVAAVGVAVVVAGVGFW